MYKLIKLEWKKNNIMRHGRNAFIMVICILIFLLAMASESEMESSQIRMSVEIFTNISFIIFTSLMLASFVIGPYKNKTINLIFSYPVNRKKIRLSQIGAVWIFNFIALVLTKISAYFMLAVTREYTHISTKSIMLGRAAFYAEILISSAVIISISLIALAIGLFMNSSKSVIIAGVVISCLTQGNIGSLTFLNNRPFYFSMFLLSIIAVYLTVFNVEKKDVL